MSRAPTLLGFPFWIGLKRRVAKKHLRRRGDMSRLLPWLVGLRVGDLYTDCSGLNRRLAGVEPIYSPVGGGHVLLAATFMSENGTWSAVTYCSVGPPVSHAQAETHRARVIEEETARGDPERFARLYSPDVMTIHADGTFTIDSAYRGRSAIFHRGLGEQSRPR